MNMNRTKRKEILMKLLGLKDNNLMKVSLLMLKLLRSLRRDLVNHYLWNQSISSSYKNINELF
jgi:hypothetical protein